MDSLLGHPLIDTLHEEMTALLAATLVPENGLADALGRLQVHTEYHFAQEESLMQERGYPGLAEHRHEHRMLLAELHGMASALARGRHRLVRAWLSERLPEWFRLHVANLDGALVSFLTSTCNQSG